jgi:hypothetical protein
MYLISILLLLNIIFLVGFFIFELVFFLAYLVVPVRTIFFKKNSRFAFYIQYKKNIAIMIIKMKISNLTFSRQLKTYGVLRLILKLSAWVIKSIGSRIGLLHRGTEKLIEYKNYTQNFIYLYKLFINNFALKQTFNNNITYNSSFLPFILFLINLFGKLADINKVSTDGGGFDGIDILILIAHGLAFLTLYYWYNDKNSKKSDKMDEGKIDDKKNNLNNDSKKKVEDDLPTFEEKQKVTPSNDLPSLDDDNTDPSWFESVIQFLQNLWI